MRNINTIVMAMLALATAASAEFAMMVTTRSTRELATIGFMAKTATIRLMGVQVEILRIIPATQRVLQSRLRITLLWTGMGIRIR